MTPHDLLANFETLAEAPNGIQRLRELVMELAVRGKLVEQDPLDEPSGALLERIRLQGANSGRQKKPGPKGKSPSTTSEEGPYEIPSSWVWVRLKEVADYNGRPNLDPSEIGSDVWVLDLEDIEKDSSRILQRLTNSTRQSRSTKSSFCKGDVLYGKLRPYLNKVVVADQDGVCTTEIVPIVPTQGLESGFLRLLLKRPGFLDYVNQLSYGVKMPRIGTSDAEQSLHPLPPTKEQRRIVARVDDLMALLDRLEAKRQEREAARTAARDSALANLRDASTLDDVEIAWLRIQDAIDILSTHEDVELFRQAILQLAVRGRLVPQDAKEESADCLLESIERAKTLRARNGEIKKVKQYPKVDPNEVSYSLPGGWVLARLDEVFDVRDGTHDTPKYVVDGIPLVTSKNLYSGTLQIEGSKLISREDHLEISKRSRVDRGDILFAMIGTVGNPVIVDIDLEFSIKNMALFKPHSHELNNMEYLLNFLKASSASMNQVAGGGVQKFVSLGFLREYPIPLPPASEQFRILTQLDSMLSKCSQLEDALRNSARFQSSFSAAAIHHLEV